MGNTITMSSQEYQQLSDKIDRLVEKIDGQFLPRKEYVAAHEALLLRVQVVENNMSAELKTADAVHERLALAADTKYDKVTEAMNGKFDKMEAKVETLDTKIDNLKENMGIRFDGLRDQASTARRSWTQWAGGLIIGLLGGGGIGSLIFYLTHLARP
jgi:outer membrane murein-binding lipoprotein Lpp